jgi:hypothetical protein
VRSTSAGCASTGSAPRRWCGTAAPTPSPTRRNAGLLAEQIPGAEMVIFLDAGHLLSANTQTSSSTLSPISCVAHRPGS